MLTTSEEGQQRSLGANRIWNRSQAHRTTRTGDLRVQLQDLRHCEVREARGAQEVQEAQEAQGVQGAECPTLRLVAVDDHRGEILQEDRQGAAVDHPMGMAVAQGDPEGQDGLGDRLGDRRTKEIRLGIGGARQQRFTMVGSQLGMSFRVWPTGSTR